MYRHFYWLSSWLLAAVLAYPADALADKDRTKRANGSAEKNNGACQLGLASKDLDVNNVRARLYNTGALFYRGSGNLYQVPKSGSASALYELGIWIGGKIEGNLVMSVAVDEGWEFWPGPLDENGDPPGDCSKFDRMFKVSRQDIVDFEDRGEMTPDLEEWPFELGAPVVDRDGDPDNYNLEAGDRPEILGDQTIWWVMNDAANVHQRSGGEPLGVEVQVTAFAFKRADALNDATFYRYKVINKGGNRIEDTYFSIWVDPDLGFSADDYVGSDTALGIGYVYNGRDFDAGAGGYGDRPPAVGVDFFQGPIVDADGVDNDLDGEIDEEGESIEMTSFVYYNLDTGPQGDPEATEDFFRYQRSIWRDNVPITFGGDGYGFSDDQALFMFPGEPGEYWSEENSDGEGTPIDPGDRRFLMTSGPFTFETGDEQTITFGIVWAQGLDRLDSVQKMKAADKLAQDAFDADFLLPAPPDEPRVAISELDETVILKWSYRPSDNNYLDQYEVENPFLKGQDLDDDTYSFEGYNILQFDSEADQVGEVIETFDIPNSVTRVFDVVEIDDITGTKIEAMTADGTDSGLQHSFQIDGLNNYTDYYFGVQAYAYNEHSDPRILKSSVKRVVVRPSKQLAIGGGTVINQEAFGADFTIDNGFVTRDAFGDGIVEARVIDPGALTGHVYRVEFFELDLSDDPRHPHEVTTYSILDATANEMIVDGTVTARSFGGAVPLGRDLVQADGLSWSVLPPPPALWGIDERGGPGSDEIVDDNLVGDLNSAAARQAGAVAFYIDAQGGDGTEEGILSRIDWRRNGAKAPTEYEIRFVENPEEDGQVAISHFTEGRDDDLAFLMRGWIESTSGLFEEDGSMQDTLRIDTGGRMPFQIWMLDPVTRTEQQVAFGILDDDDDGYWAPFRTDGSMASFEDGSRSYERIYATDVPYDEEFLLANADSVVAQDVWWNCFPACHVFGRLLFTPWKDDYRPGATGRTFARPPSPGTVVRLVTSKPRPGDVFTVDTEGYATEHNNPSALREALELISVVPNPYKGASVYEITNLDDVVRFTNMPEEATIRIFTLAGTLIKTIVKSSRATSIEWDLRTEEGLPIGSGMYLIHVDVPGVGEKIIKFGAIKKRPYIELY